MESPPAGSRPRKPSLVEIAQKTSEEAKPGLKGRSVPPSFQTRKPKPREGQAACQNHTASLRRKKEKKKPFSEHLLCTQVALVVKNLPARHETQGIRAGSLGWEDHLEEKMATPSSILPWSIPWTEEPGGLWLMGSQTVGHD